LKVIVNTGRKVVLAVTLGMKIGPPGGRDVTKRSHGPGSILEMSDKDAQFHIGRGDVRKYEPPSSPAANIEAHSS